MVMWFCLFCWLLLCFLILVCGVFECFFECWFGFFFGGVW